MTPPRCAFGRAPSGAALSPPGGRHQRPGKAGSAVAAGPLPRVRPMVADKRRVFTRVIAS